MPVTEKSQGWRAFEKAAAFAAFIVFAFPSPGTGYEFQEEKTERSLQIVTGRMSGFTKYYVNPDSEVESELEFPLDVLVTGLCVKFRSTTEGGRLWRVAGALHTNLVSPRGPMKDSDWTVKAGDGRVMIRYSESDASLRTWQFDGEARLGLAASKRFSFEGIVGLMYQRLSFDMEGIDGWRLVGDTLVRNSWDEGVQVLDYRVSHLIPFVGAGVGVAALPALSLNLDLLLSPRASSKDRDDHLRRGLLMEASDVGYAALVNTYASWRISSGAAGRRWFLALSGSLLEVETEGTQVRRWYGDDPLTLWDDTGAVLSDIHDEITSTQYRVDLSLGVRF